MAEKKVEEKKVEVKIEKTDRQVRWDKHVANYKLENPVKGAAKEKRGEFSQIPDSFK